MISVRKSLLFGAMCMLLIMLAAYSGSHKAIVHWVHAQGLANTGEQVEFMAEYGGKYATELSADSESVKISKLCDDSLFAVTSDEPVTTKLTAKIHDDDGEVITGTYEIEFKDEAAY